MYPTPTYKTDAEERSPENAIQEGSAPSTLDTLFSDLDVTASATRVELIKAMKRKGKDRGQQRRSSSTAREASPMITSFRVHLILIEEESRQEKRSEKENKKIGQKIKSSDRLLP